MTEGHHPRYYGRIVLELSLKGGRISKSKHRRKDIFM
jgi:hypothetical protein